MLLNKNQGKNAQNDKNKCLDKHAHCLCKRIFAVYISIFAAVGTAPAKDILSRVDNRHKIDLSITVNSYGYVCHFSFVFVLEFPGTMAFINPWDFPPLPTSLHH